MTPILVLGAGRMGGALIKGWRKAGVFPSRDLIIREPYSNPLVEAEARAGARVNPPDAVLGEAETVLLCVKPQVWRETAAQVSDLLAADAVIVSVAAGVTSQALSAGFGGRRVARVMPTTAAAIGQGTASIHAADAQARARAHALLDPVATTADLDDEGLMHAATAVSGSAPAYLYAFIEALEAGGVAAGLSPQVSADLARLPDPAARRRRGGGAALEGTGRLGRGLRSRRTIRRPH